jgi:RNA polymerase sigma-70 factor (ECF subfamily)
MCFSRNNNQWKSPINQPVLQEKKPYSQEHYFESFQRGEEKGFNFFFNTYYRALTWFATSLIKDEESARDLVEECFIKFWQKREGIQHAKAVKSYLYTSVRNACLEHLQKIKKQLAAKKGFQYLSPDSDRPILHHIIESEVLREIYAALNTLPPQCKKVIQMLYLEGKGYQEIASELDLSIRTIKNHRARGLALLQGRLPSALLLLLLLQA